MQFGCHYLFIIFKYFWGGGGGGQTLTWNSTGLSGRERERENHLLNLIVPRYISKGIRSDLINDHERGRGGGGVREGDNKSLESDDDFDQLRSIAESPLK